jgi:thymidylate synthase ThyX
MTTFDKNLYAEVVFDGLETRVPACMGTPKEGQLLGTPLERLVELAGRVCYDSLGKGRSSVEYHAHIAEVRHGSVWEHANVTLRVPRFGENMLAAAMQFINRPGVWMRFGGDGALRVTMNLRSLLEFDDFSVPVAPWTEVGPVLRSALFGAVAPLAPQIVRCSAAAQESTTVRVVAPEFPEEKWVSLLLGGSRGMSHEQVRHKWRTAVSQRSTRYVDESESPWVEHPLVTKYREETGAEDEDPVRPVAVEQYSAAVEVLEEWLAEKGVDKHTSRKQARGAARGYLGNALHTELIFSASVAQWRRMLVTGTSARCSPGADAEIRVLYGHVLRALKTTHWAEDFADIELVPSPDGIGEVAQLMAGSPA